MSNYIVLNKSKNKKKVLDLIKDLGLIKILQNKRTIMYQNDDLEISIDKSIIRVLIYNKEDVQYYKQLFM